MINNFLAGLERVGVFWLADDSYDCMPRMADGKVPVAILAPIHPRWRSPFVGYSIEQAADFLAKSPRDKYLCIPKDHFVFLDPKLNLNKGWMQS